MREIYHRAESLPECWDSAAGDHYAMKRSFLMLMEQGNDLGQKYYLFRDHSGRPDTIMMLYEHPRFNIFMFTPVDIFFRVSLVYVPLSIARPGIILGGETFAELEETLNEIPGYKVILNMDDTFRPRNFHRGLTCPRILLDLKWKSFDGYLASMRSSYRRRCQLALQKMNDLELKILEDNSRFDETLYELYEQVYNRSVTKIEKLNIQFFQAQISRILILSYHGKPLGFIQLIPNGKEIVFAFVGYEYSSNRQHDTYMNLLLAMIRYSVEQGYDMIDLGQTADDAKLKLGGRYVFLNALISNRNPVLNWFVGLLAPFLQYPVLKENFRVFKDGMVDL